MVEGKKKVCTWENEHKVSSATAISLSLKESTSKLTLFSILVCVSGVILNDYSVHVNYEKIIPLMSKCNDIIIAD